MTPSILEAMKYKFDVGSFKQHDYTWFDIGEFRPPSFNDVSYAESRAHLPELFRTDQLPEDLPMPFERVGIVCTAPGKSKGSALITVTVEKAENDTCTLGVVRLVKGALCQLLHDGNRSKKGELDFSYDAYDPMWSETVLGVQRSINPSLTINDLTLEMHDAHARYAAHLVRALYWEMMHKLVDRKESIKAVRPIPNPTNAKRVAKGKKPLFEWKVIEVSGVQQPPPTEPTGRTHASPRLHKRRGHVRRYKNGKVLWIKEMMVGKIEFGYIHHSYTAS